MNVKLKIDESYQEQVTLATGETIRLRLIRPTDKASMRKAFFELSQPSRHKRFLAAKKHLTDEELRYFTEIDGINHFALAAAEIDASGRESDGFGIARCVRLENDPTCAEVAITVIDRMQGKGIGRILLQRLIAAAVERDISRFRFECLAHNHEVQRLVKKVCRVVDTRNDGGIVIVETDLPQVARASSQPARRPLFNIFDLLRAIAIQSVDMQLKFNRSALNRTFGSSVRDMNLLRGHRAPLHGEKFSMESDTGKTR